MAGPIALTPPPGDPRCVALTSLPTLDGLAAREVTPASPYTAAWGHPAVTLRCGLPVPVDPQGQLALCLSPDASCTPRYEWYEDALDPNLFTTRVAPVLAVHVPTLSGVSEILGPLTDALTSARRP